MSSFRTTIPSIAFPFSINHTDSIMGMGSCFAQSIGEKLVQAKFDTLLNPFGIIYHPLGIVQSFRRLLDDDFSYQEADLISSAGLWYSFEHHSDFSQLDKDICLEKINTALFQARIFLAKTNRMLLTFGTARVYHHLERDQLVVNCHKFPTNDFERRLLSVDDIVGAWTPILEQLQNKKADLQIMITISPIRHIRDGLVENQESKATLLLAAHQLAKQFPYVHYFPAYELVLDDLRDYRFFEEDMIHPSQQAINYVWEYFKTSFFDTTTEQLLQEIQKIQTKAAHRAFHPTSAAHQQFLVKAIEQINQLEQQYGIHLNEERIALSKDLIAKK